MIKLISIVVSIFLSVFLYGIYNYLKVIIDNDQKKIQSLESSIVEKDRLLLSIEIKDLLLKDPKYKNMTCIDILRGEDLNSIRYVKMLEYRVDSLQNHLYDLKRF